MGVAGMYGVEFGVLGRFRVLAGGREGDLGPPQQRALLAVLVLRAGEIVSADALASAIWGDRAPATAANIVQGYVAGLRGALEPERERGAAPRLLLTRPPGYLLDIVPEQVDAVRFERAVEAARRLEAPGERARALRAALGLWRGEALADLEGWEFARGTRVRLAGLRRTVLDERIEADLALGLHAELVPELEALAAAEPLRERTHGHLMAALYGAGRQADALAAFDRARRSLADELGLDPGPELRSLETAILRQELPRPVRERAAAGALPIPSTDLIGRDGALAEISGLLDDHRLVTLTGTGGVGKTRLALAAARDRDGAVWVDLAELSDPSQVEQAVRASLGLEPGAALSDLLRDAPRTLLVLDNCEHLVDACADLVAGLLRDCAQVRVLATSREALDFAGESAWAVPPLAGPDAATLFRRRAAGGAHEAAGDDAICRRLDGLPLAIELAAARTRVLSAAEIAARLDDRFAVLGRGGRDVSQRHRTLTAVMEWSHALLTDAERDYFARLSVFRGGFGVAAAEALADPPGDGLDLLGRLVDKSLLVRGTGALGRSRFRMLETLRRFGEDRLAEQGGVKSAWQRHAGFYAAFAGELAPLVPAARVESLDLLGEEFGNLRAALLWALENGEAHHAAEIVGNCWPLWVARGIIDEALELVERTLETCEGGSPGLLAPLLYAKASVSGMRGDLAKAGEAALACVEAARAAGLRIVEARATTCLSLVAWTRGDSASAKSLALDCLPLLREVRDHAHVALLLSHLGRLAETAEDADRYFAEAESQVRQVGVTHLVGFVLGLRADRARRSGDHDTALALSEQALAAYHADAALPRPGRVVNALVHTVGIAGWLGADPLQAISAQFQVVSAVPEPRHSPITCIETLADVAVAQQRLALAVVLLGAADGQRELRAEPVPDSERARHAARIAACRAALGAEFDTFWSTGRTLKEDDLRDQVRVLGVTPD
ncbi:BTAD domain-containing putative transcriptional regulator [Actinocorallia longicatena]|uniref:OmpR/PhoB-type domain-containing protein n=1 Tax=Actinocorallia longicatena TaxID=111803 RepID=A0ABP6Q7H3_9ACTN